MAVVFHVRAADLYDYRLCSSVVEWGKQHYRIFKKLPYAVRKCAIVKIRESDKSKKNECRKR